MLVLLALHRFRSFWFSLQVLLDVKVEEEEHDEEHWEKYPSEGVHSYTALRSSERIDGAKEGEDDDKLEYLHSGDVLPHHIHH